MPNLYGATGSRTAQGRPGADSIDVNVLVDSRGRVITVPGAFYQSPSGLVRPRATSNGTQVVTLFSEVLPNQGQFGLSVTSSAVVELTVPAGANAAEIYVRTASVVFLRDGTIPTATKGFQADATDIILLNSRSELDDFKVIAVSTSASLDVEFLTDVSG